MLKVKYAKVEKVKDQWKGFILDVDDYLAILPSMANDLPSGARAFAEDEGHYDFFSVRCVKDLVLAGSTTREVDGCLEVELKFSPNQFKHEQGLQINYRRVAEFSVVAVEAGWSVVQLDEILPHELGCSHEIKTIGGHVWIVAGDISTKWIDAVL